MQGLTIYVLAIVSSGGVALTRQIDSRTWGLLEYKRRLTFMTKDPKIPHLLTKNTKPPSPSFFILFLLGRGVLAVLAERGGNRSGRNERGQAAGKA